MKVERELLKREEMFWWMNILVPLFVGMALYCILNTPYFLSGLIRRLYGPGRISLNGREMISEKTFLLILTYGRDFLWAFSLMFAVARLYRNSLSGLEKAFSLVFLFEAFVEIWKIVRLPESTLEFTGMAAVFCADILAILIILAHKRALV